MTELYTISAETAAGRLIASVAEDWERYTRHRFVEGLADGSLPEACFRFYLIQDYRFLVHFARAYALAAFKSDDIDEIKHATGTVQLIADEMDHHLRTCALWGLDEAQVRSTPEHPSNAAYTRFVLERGLAGDLADLLVALAPCFVGYAEIGARLGRHLPDDDRTHPYRDWIATYADEDFQQGAIAATAQLDKVLARRMGPEPWTLPRWPELVETFGAATRLEIAFWEMGLAAR